MPPPDGFNGRLFSVVKSYVIIYAALHFSFFNFLNIYLLFFVVIIGTF